MTVNYKFTVAGKEIIKWGPVRRDKDLIVHVGARCSKAGESVELDPGTRYKVCPSCWNKVLDEIDLAPPRGDAEGKVRAAPPSPPVPRAARVPETRPPGTRPDTPAPTKRAPRKRAPKKT